ncbi:DNA-packaging protein [Paraburkholderia sp. CNPSo 3274]|uniref:DNA-packaging protein n=1 Tax=Paraburkholderia sp. CNPSo 3274 TaxID=2940932 RepID=UPI0020B818D1|nr:DNA-packaging protein [Paraburkholderia sp. CNPSo 3274]MCP3709738.1 DNA-packaging protein [Paraburkholderia sp. CNPSo 3274]
MAGRPTAFREEFIELARNYSLLGATQEEIGPLLGVTGRTIKNWKRDHPAFAAALNEGSKHANARVVGALFNRCIQGDVTAIIWWSKNKMGWRDKADINANLSGKIETVTRRIIDPKEPEKK